MDLVELAAIDDALLDLWLVGAEGDCRAVAVQTRDRRCGALDQAELPGVLDVEPPIDGDDPVPVEQHRAHRLNLPSLFAASTAGLPGEAAPWCTAWAPC